MANSQTTRGVLVNQSEREIVFDGTEIVSIRIHAYLLGKQYGYKLKKLGKKLIRLQPGQSFPIPFELTYNTSKIPADHKEIQLGVDIKRTSGGMLSGFTSFIVGENVDEILLQQFSRIK